jgi:hypothetical protein
MLRRVALVRIDVSEKPGASFIRVTRIGEEQPKLQIPNQRTLRRITKIEQHKLQLATEYAAKKY